MIKAWLVGPLAPRPRLFGNSIPRQFPSGALMVLGPQMPVCWPGPLRRETKSNEQSRSDETNRGQLTEVLDFKAPSAPMHRRTRSAPTGAPWGAPHHETTHHTTSKRPPPRETKRTRPPGARLTKRIGADCRKSLKGNGDELAELAHRGRTDQRTRGRTVPRTSGRSGVRAIRQRTGRRSVGRPLSGQSLLVVPGGPSLTKEQAAALIAAQEAAELGVVVAVGPSE